MTLTSTGLGLGTQFPSANLHIAGNGIVTNKISVGSTSMGSSNLNINGSIGCSIQEVSNDLTLGQHSIILVDTSSDNIYLKLPFAGNYLGTKFTIKKTSNLNYLWLTCASSSIDLENIYGMTTSSNLTKPNMTVLSNGLQWYVMEKSEGVQPLSSDNLVAWWKLDESTGTTASDSSGGGHDGALDNGLNFLSHSVDGRVGKALTFDGVNQRINTSDIAFGGTSPISISVWANTNTITGLHNIIAQGTEIVLRQDNATVVFILNSFTSNDRFVTSPVLSIGQWYHLVGTYESEGSISVYVNGVYQGSSTPTGTYNNIGNSFTLGDLFGYSQYWDGSLDDLRIYNKALSYDEIQALYHLGN